MSHYDEERIEDVKPKKKPAKRKSRAKPKAEHKQDGRPPVVLSDEQIVELKALAAVLNKEQLADYFGVSHVTLLAIEERQPDVSLAYKQGKARAIASIAGNLISQAKSGNVSAAIFYLKTQAGWKEPEVQKSGDNVAGAINDLINRLPG